MFVCVVNSLCFCSKRLFGFVHVSPQRDFIRVALQRLVEIVVCLASFDVLLPVTVISFIVCRTLAQSGPRTVTAPVLNFPHFML